MTETGQTKRTPRRPKNILAVGMLTSVCWSLLSGCQGTTAQNSAANSAMSLGGDLVESTAWDRCRGNTGKGPLIGAALGLGLMLGAQQLDHKELSQRNLSPHPDAVLSVNPRVYQRPAKLSRRPKSMPLTR